MFIRNTYIDKFKEILLTSEKQFIVLVGWYAAGKTHLLESLRDDGTLDENTTLFIDTDNTSIEDALLQAKEDTTTIVIDSEHGINDTSFRSFIESFSYDYRVILTSEEQIDDERVVNFSLPYITFREYAETLWIMINTTDIMSGTADIDRINIAKDEYISLGHFPRHISDPETIHDDFLSKCTEMKSEMFEKEYEQFIEFCRSLAMETGVCFKADKLAKLLGITRRKVNKYMEILLKYSVVKAIGPWVQDAETETSRHVKIYFSDLSFYHSLLSDMYYQWAMKLGALENFIYLELDRKLRTTHDIYYYRKKSGSELTFILEDRTTKKITPVEVVSRDIDFLSQALKSFDSEYHDRVERYMVMNESKAIKKDLNGTPVFILPHATI